MTPRMVCNTDVVDPALMVIVHGWRRDSKVSGLSLLYCLQDGIAVFGIF